ncbi:DUF4158 domain-containing protein [Nitrosospira sp. Nsp13]|uniref:DUF4158 domain-containing protein n=1 Tax=Nitrosospira sp. Nsp13 TaxID=1855332 RepID=UPI000B81E4AB
MELALLPNHSDSGRLGCAILLKFFQFQGFFPSHQKSIPHEVVVYIAQATNSAPEDLDVYEWDGRTGQRHRKKILSFFGSTPPVRGGFAAVTHMADRRNLTGGGPIRAIARIGGGVVRQTIVGTA